MINGNFFGNEMVKNKDEINGNNKQIHMQGDLQCYWHFHCFQGVWSTPPQNEAKLNKAVKACKNVILIYSVKESGKFQGNYCSAIVKRFLQLKIINVMLNIGNE